MDRNGWPALTLTDLAIAGANAGLAMVVNQQLRTDRKLA
jgi:hypothetical protein